MKKLNPREALILTITLGLAVFFIVHQWVIKPMAKGSVDIDDRLRLDRAQIMRDNRLMAQRPLIEARYKNLVKLVGRSDSEEAQMPTIVSKIEAAAREANVHIENIQPQKSITQKMFSFSVVELEIDGQWIDIVQFLSMLQQQPNFYFINELNLEKYSDTTNSLRGRIIVARASLVNL